MDAKGTSKILVSYVNNKFKPRLLISHAEDCMRELTYFPFNTRLVIFTKTFIFNKLKNQPTTTVTTEYSENIMLLTLYIKYLNPHQATSLLGQIMPKKLALNPTVNYRINYLTTIVPYP